MLPDDAQNGEAPERVKRSEIPRRLELPVRTKFRLRDLSSTRRKLCAFCWSGLSQGVLTKPSRKYAIAAAAVYSGRHDPRPCSRAAERNSSADAGPPIAA